MLDFRPQGRGAPNYLGRREQWRLLLLIACVAAVMLLFAQARRPFLALPFGVRPAPTGVLLIFPRNIEYSRFVVSVSAFSVVEVVRPLVAERVSVPGSREPSHDRKTGKLSGFPRSP